MAIYGNPITFGGGSLKATDALLRVQAPAGSTVTITKGTTTKTDLGHENADDNSVYDYYFIIHQSQFDSQNAWTVTATLGTQTATKTVIIDAADEYDLIMSYHVPSGYQEVEYLEGTGTQYLLTGVKLPNDFWTKQTHFRFEYMFTSSSGIQAMFGGDYAVNTSSGPWYDTPVLQYRNNATNFNVGNASATKIITAAINNKYDLDVIGNGTSYSFTQGSSSDSWTINTSGMNNNYILSIAAFAVMTKSGSVDSKGHGRLYYALAEVDGTPILELYPCYRKSDNVAGMWDKVSETFFTNQGTGSFVVGGDVN